MAEERKSPLESFNYPKSMHLVFNPMTKYTHVDNYSLYVLRLTKVEAIYSDGNDFRGNLAIDEIPRDYRVDSKGNRVLCVGEDVVSKFSEVIKGNKRLGDIEREGIEITFKVRNWVEFKYDVGRQIRQKTGLLIDSEELLRPIFDEYSKVI
ncbi:hypothetical protein J4405_02950 [Candidatus Woesearchaeota archaeon]|nr:hypothetical protein [Candidatus Woesearchaeota archaeon]